MIRHFRHLIQGPSESFYYAENDGRRGIELRIRRDHVYEDAFASLADNKGWQFLDVGSPIRILLEITMVKINFILDEIVVSYWKLCDKLWHVAY